MLKLSIVAMAAVAILASGCGDSPTHKKKKATECDGDEDCRNGYACTWYGECIPDPQYGEPSDGYHGDNNPTPSTSSNQADDCSSDQDCAPGDICRSGSCVQETDERVVWCWDDDLSDRDGVEGGTCHNFDGYWSPPVWRRADYPDGPPACGAPQGYRTRYPTQVECCRAGSDFDTRSSVNYRECLAQPDGSAWTWNE